jgi:indole-3-glycerol phosphate synthase
MSAVAGAGFLATKATAVRADVAERGDVSERDQQLLLARCRRLPAPPSLAAALSGGDRVAVMAEYKRRSPSAGALAEGESPVTVAGGYRAAGAVALSVLTDAPDFHGSLRDLEAVAMASPGTPVLRKDFLVHPIQLLEARLAGASAALLIAAMLDDAELTGLLARTGEAGLEALVEVHTESEMERATEAGARLIGINNRDLSRLETDLAVTERLARLAPAGAVVVSESGIRSADDVRRIRDAGVHAVLVGEALLRRPPTERAALLAALARVPR